jgi:hypothetical protein
MLPISTGSLALKRILIIGMVFHPLRRLDLHLARLEWPALAPAVPDRSLFCDDLCEQSRADAQVLNWRVSGGELAVA